MLRAFRLVLLAFDLDTKADSFFRGVYDIKRRVMPTPAGCSTSTTTMILRTLAVLLLAALLAICRAAENVTIDDSDSSIQYTGGWGLNSESNEDDYGGFHHVTSDRSAYATLSFTGVLIFHLFILLFLMVNRDSTLFHCTKVAI
jgi:hypothetical protein